jgi:cell division inhibitor SepF
MDYLGLGPDDAYDDYDEEYPPEPAARGGRGPREGEGRPQAPNGGPSRGWEGESEPAVRTVSARPSFPSRDFESSPSRRASPAPRQDDSGVQVRPAPSAAPPPRSSPGGSMEPHTVRPRRFDQAQEVADSFKEGQPVIMNLEGTEREVARRLIDFASGLCYALDGSMEKVATGVYLLKPPAPRQAGYDDYDDYTD